MASNILFEKPEFTSKPNKKKAAGPPGIESMNMHIIMTLGKQNMNKTLKLY